FFDLLGVRAQLGRSLLPNETWSSTGLAHTIVISDRFWRQRFAADPRIVGRTVRIDGQPNEIVGVAPAGFSFPSEGIDIWQPTAWTPDTRGQDFFRRAHFLRAIARLSPGASLATADAELQTVAGRLKLLYPGTNKYMVAGLTSLHKFLVGATRLPLLVRLAAVALLLLIACANVGNLLLVQAAGREREAALRLALGAGRARLVRQGLTESLVLSTIGGACGLALGWAGTRALVRLQPRDMLRVHDFGVDRSVIVYLLAITVISALI